MAHLKKKNNTIQSYNKSMKKCPSSIQRRDLNPQRLEHESSSITTRPGLPPNLQKFCLTILVFLLVHRQRVDGDATFAASDRIFAGVVERDANQQRPDRAQPDRTSSADNSSACRSSRTREDGFRSISSG